jgi:hypothetical protein
MHFTYKEQPDTVNLCQGDLLRRTPALDDVLRDIHRHYFETVANRLFIVLTQSCDLVLRTGRCKSAYITIAAVRELEFVLERELWKFQRSAIERDLNLCDIRYQTDMLRFMERLLNNNESEYFYLRREPAFGLDSDMCALLQLSVPLKSDRHYETLLQAKMAQLSESFEHKLAYLLGTIYGRIATEDWVPHNATEEQFEQLKKEAVEGMAVWIPSELHAKVIGRLRKIPEQQRTHDEVDKLAAEIEAEREGKLTEVLDEIGAVFRQHGVTEQVVTAARKVLRNRAAFAGRIK